MSTTEQTTTERRPSAPQPTTRPDPIRVKVKRRYQLLGKLRVVLGYPHTMQAEKTVKDGPANVSALDRIHTREIVSDYADLVQHDTTNKNKVLTRELNRHRTADQHHTPNSPATPPYNCSADEGFIASRINSYRCPMCDLKPSAYFDIDKFLEHSILQRRVQRLEPISENAFAIESNLTYQSLDFVPEVLCASHQTDQPSFTTPKASSFVGTSVSYAAVPLGLFPKQQSANISAVDNRKRTVRIASSSDSATWTMQCLGRMYPRIFATIPPQAEETLFHFLRSTRIPLAIALLDLRMNSSSLAWLCHLATHWPENLTAFLDHLKALSHNRMFFALIPKQHSHEVSITVTAQKTMDTGETQIDLAWQDITKRVVNYINDHHVTSCDKSGFKHTYDGEPGTKFIDNDFEDTIDDIENVLHRVRRQQLPDVINQCATRLTAEALWAYHKNALTPTPVVTQAKLGDDLAIEFTAQPQRPSWDNDTSTLTYKHNRLGSTVSETLSPTEFTTGCTIARKAANADVVELSDLLKLIWPKQGIRFMGNQDTFTNGRSHDPNYRFDTIYDWGWAPSDRYKIHVNDDMSVLSTDREFAFPEPIPEIKELYQYDAYAAYPDYTEGIFAEEPSQHDITTRCVAPRRRHRLRPANRQNKDSSFIYWQFKRNINIEHHNPVGCYTEPETKGTGHNSRPKVFGPLGAPRHFIYTILPDKSVSATITMFSIVAVLFALYNGVLIDVAAIISNHHKLTVGGIWQNSGILLLSGDRAPGVMNTSGYEVGGASLVATSVAILSFAAGSTNKDILRRALQPLYNTACSAFIMAWAAIGSSFVVHQIAATERYSFWGETTIPGSALTPIDAFSLSVSALWLVLAICLTTQFVRNFRQIMFVTRLFRST